MRKLLMIAMLAFYLLAHGQIPEILWQECFGSEGNNYGNAICKTDNGYLIGTSVSSPEGVTNYHGSGDIWIVSIDSLGNTLWEKCYGGSEGESPVKIIRNNNDYVILGGTTSSDGDVQSANNGGIDYWIFNINGQGDILWEKCYGTPSNEGPNDILLAPDNGLLVMGRIHSSGGDVSVYYGSNDVWMFKTDSIGNIEWEKTLGNQWNDNGISIMLNSENNIMLMGAVDHYGGMIECGPENYYGDVWLVEIDLFGNIISQHCYGGSSYEYGISIKETEYGYVFLANSYSNDGDVSGHHGSAGVPPNGYNDFWIVKINELGDIIWEYSYGGYDSDDPQYITQTINGGLLAIGTTFSNDGDVSGNHSNPGWDTDIWAIKLDSIGGIEWQKCYGGWGSERLESPHTILKKDDYNYVIASSSDYSPSYDVQCEPISGVERDAWVFEIDTDDTTGLYDNPVAQDNLRVYPNPAKDFVVFEIQSSWFESSKLGSSLITLLDVYGNEVDRLKITNKKTVWQTKDVNQGLYFYKIETGGEVLSGKIVVQ